MKEAMHVIECMKDGGASRAQRKHVTQGRSRLLQNGNRTFQLSKQFFVAGKYTGKVRWILCNMKLKEKYAFGFFLLFTRPTWQRAESPVEVVTRRKIESREQGNSNTSNIYLNKCLTFVISTDGEALVFNVPVNSIRHACLIALDGRFDVKKYGVEKVYPLQMKILFRIVKGCDSSRYKDSVIRIFHLAYSLQ